MGYLLKNSGAAELEIAVRAAARGETYLSPAISKHVITDYIRRIGGAAPESNPLTPRQREILRLVAEGSDDQGDRQPAGHQRQDGGGSQGPDDGPAGHPRRAGPGPLRDPDRAGGAGGLKAALAGDRPSAGRTSAPPGFCLRERGEVSMDPASALPDPGREGRVHADAGQVDHRRIGDTPERPVAQCRRIYPCIKTR